MSQMRDNGKPHVHPSFWSLLGPSTLISIMLLLVYLMVYIDHYFFCQRLSLPCRDLDLPNYFYIKDMLILAAFLVIVIPLSLNLWRIFYKKGIFCLIGNIIFILAPLAYAYLIYYYNKLYPCNTFMRNSFILITSSIFLISTFVVMKYYNLDKSLSKRLYVLIGDFIRDPYSHSITEYRPIIFYFAVILLVLGLSSSLIGDLHASKLVEGNLSDSIVIEYELKDNLSKIPLDKTLLFITCHDGNYFVVEKNISPQDCPKIYIIPSKQVKSATMQRIRPKDFSLI